MFGGVLLLAFTTCQANASTCGRSEVALQVLGSGGPIADSDRASSGYLIWHKGRARVLVDAGGGVFVRFGQSGARMVDLDLVALTHLHTDHVADLPAILKGGYFSSRISALPISGPDGNHLMPSPDAFFNAMFSGQHGAFSYLSGFLDGTDGLFALNIITLDTNDDRPALVFKHKDLQVKAVSVHHGPVPTLAYLFEIGSKRIVIGGDSNLEGSALIELANSADIMVLPMAIPENAGTIARNLHARPSRIGEVANSVGPAHLVIAHLMARSLRDLDANIAEIRKRYPGRLTVATDLACFELGQQRRQ
jgi:ribonuclease BN (tRNA processing enzyme)